MQDLQILFELLSIPDKAVMPWPAEIKSPKSRNNKMHIYMFVWTDKDALLDSTTLASVKEDFVQDRLYSSVALRRYC